jgi:hypothetical protein
MNDLTFTYNTSDDVLNPTSVEFLFRRNDFLNGNISNAKWVVRVNNYYTHWSVTERVDVDMVYYDLELLGEPIKMFEFEKGGLTYLPNLFSVYEFILNKGLNFQEGQF